MPNSNDSRVFKPTTLGLAAGLIAAVITGPIAAQQRDRPSRECMREIQELCPSAGARDRSQIRACLQERAGELSSQCSAELSQRFQDRAARSRGAERASRPYQAPARIARTVIYGGDTRQQIDVYEPDDVVEEAPLVLFIHGGAWSMGSRTSVQSKPAHFGASGYYFASAGYRLLPDSPVEQQVSDLGAAIQALRGQASAIGFDPDQIVLMGHSAGAHLAALAASNPAYAGDAFGAIRGVILLDGAGYDIAASLDGARPRQWQLYNNVFGSDPARHAALSPLTYVGGADAPNWLALYVEERVSSRAQSESLMAGLSQAGVNARAMPISGTDHGRMNREIGTADGAQQTDAIDAFLAQIFD